MLPANVRLNNANVRLNNEQYAGHVCNLHDMLHICPVMVRAVMSRIFATPFCSSSELCCFGSHLTVVEALQEEP